MYVVFYFVSMYFDVEWILHVNGSVDLPGYLLAGGTQSNFTYLYSCCVQRGKGYHNYCKLLNKEQCCLIRERSCQKLCITLCYCQQSTSSYEWTKNSIVSHGVPCAETCKIASGTILDRLSFFWRLDNWHVDGIYPILITWFPTEMVTRSSHSNPGRLIVGCNGEHNMS